MSTNIELQKQLNQLSAELNAVKQEFSEFRQAVEILSPPLAVSG